MRGVRCEERRNRSRQRDRAQVDRQWGDVHRRSHPAQDEEQKAGGEGMEAHTDRVMRSCGRTEELHIERVRDPGEGVPVAAMEFGE